MIFIALLFLILSVMLEGKNNFWNFMFLILSISMWFILAQVNLNIETFYASYNATSGTTTPMYDLYANSATIYVSYVFMGIGIIGIIYLIILLFGNYYENLDKKEKKTWDGTEE